MTDILDFKRHMAAALIALHDQGMLKSIERNPGGTLLVNMGSYNKSIAPIMDMKPDTLARRLIRSLTSGQFITEFGHDRLMGVYRSSIYTLDTLNFAVDEMLELRPWLAPLFTSIDELATPVTEQVAA